jgi:hypothetical protein
MLKPLTEFYCDTCHNLIKDISHGYVDWISASSPQTIRKDNGFRIIHKQNFSPLSGSNGCYIYTGNKDLSSLPLNSFLNDTGIIQLLSLLDVGVYHAAQYKGPTISDMREFVEFFRRLTIPYYEEARLYWQEAENNGDFSGDNEINIYSPDKLKDIIKKYAP